MVSPDMRHIRLQTVRSAGRGQKIEAMVNGFGYSKL